MPLRFVIYMLANRTHGGKVAMLGIPPGATMPTRIRSEEKNHETGFRILPAYAQ